MNQDHAPDFRTIFSVMPGASALVMPDSPRFTVIGSTDEFAAFAGVRKDDLIGSSLFTYFPDNPAAPNMSEDIRASLEACIRNRRKNELKTQRYDIETPDGTFLEMYWTVIHTPIFDASGQIDYIIHTAIDVTDRIVLGRRDETIRSLEPAHNLFMQAAIAIHIFKGADLVIELANEPSLKLWGRDQSILGKPLREALPELVEQKYEDIIDLVRRTGIPYHAHEARLSVRRGGQIETGYYNFILQPYYESGDTYPVGVLAMFNEVTNIYNDRKALVEKERSLQLAVEIGELGVFNIDLRSNTVSYSPQIMEWFGVTRLNLPLEQLLRKVHEDDYAMASEALLSKWKRDRKHDIVFRVVNEKSGDVLYLRSIGQIQEEDGTPVTLSGIIQDISASVRSKFALEQSAQHLKSLIESAPFPIGVYVGREMRVEMVNQAILDAWHRDHSAIGKTYAEVLPELDGQGPYEQLLEVYDTGKPFHAHNQRIDLHDGEKLNTYYFNYSFTPLFDSNGKVYGVMNTAADVTDLNVAKKALEESERNFRTMILQAPLAMCMLRGRDLVVEIANQAMIEIWGKPREAVMNRPIFEALPDATRQGLEELISKAFEGHSVVERERELKLVRFGKEETVFLDFVYEPHRDGNGNVIGILAVAVDVTEKVNARRKIEDIVRERTLELELANLHLQKSNAELEQFAYIASHDLQEPLRKISMFTGMLETALGHVDEKAKYHIDRIENAANRMTNLISDILGYSQLARKTEVFKKVKLEKVLDEAIGDFDIVMEEKKGRITRGDLPVIDAIPSQMLQLFNNLISNSLKYSRPGVPPEIRVEAELLDADQTELHSLPRSSKGYVKMVFSDNGIGFPQAYAERIFQIFQRLHGKQQFQGTGIGLAMCRKIAENHNGLIFAKGDEELGAEFTVILPISQSNKKS